MSSQPHQILQNCPSCLRKGRENVVCKRPRSVVMQYCAADALTVLLSQQEVRGVHL